MFQSLVVSPLFLKSFGTLDADKAYSVMSYLATEIFLCDRNKKLLEEYDKIREDLKNDNNSVLFVENFIKHLTIGRIKPMNNVLSENRNMDDWNDYEIEKLLAVLDNWKIILTDKSNKDLAVEFKTDLGVELSDIENYISPLDGSVIRSLQRITKQPSEEFNFRDWIKKYIIDSSSLIIHDGYACANREFKDVDFLIKALPANASVQIITLSDSARNDSRKGSKGDGIIAEEKLSELKSRYRNKNIEWKLRDEKKLIEDRHLETDKFIIDLGHSLGSTYKDKDSGKILCKKQFTISVSKK